MMKRSMDIRRIVGIWQRLRAWRIKAASERSAPDVPPGHVAVSVGISYRRFIVRATHLNHPIFRELLRQVEEEYGFSNSPGLLLIPCTNESHFQNILQCVAAAVKPPHSPPKRCTTNHDDFAESPLLLSGLTSS